MSLVWDTVDELSTINTDVLTAFDDVGAQWLIVSQGDTHTLYRLPHAGAWLESRRMGAFATRGLAMREATACSAAIEWSDMQTTTQEYRKVHGRNTHP